MTARLRGYSGGVERDDHLDPPIERAAEEMASDVEEMEARSAELGEDVDDLRSDWKRKRQDPSVPGAEPEDEDEDEAGGEVAGDWEGEGPAADDAGQ